MYTCLNKLSKGTGGAEFHLLVILSLYSGLHVKKAVLCHFTLVGDDEICSWLKKVVCFLECCSSLEMSSQSINIWTVNPNLT